MSFAELKEKLIHQIESSEDVDLLEDISRLIEVELSHEKIFQLNKVQTVAISEAREQIKNGVILTEEQANQEIDEWLGK